MTGTRGFNLWLIEVNKALVPVPRVEQRGFERGGEGGLNDHCKIVIKGPPHVSRLFDVPKKVDKVIIYVCNYYSTYVSIVRSLDERMNECSLVGSCINKLVIIIFKV
jgi:hypothetical protein